MDYSEDDGEFHFIAVAEEEGVVGCMPCWVHSERVYANLSCCDQLSNFEFLRPYPSGFKQGYWFGKQVIVYQSRIPFISFLISSVNTWRNIPSITQYNVRNKSCQTTTINPYL